MNKIVFKKVNGTKNIFFLGFLSLLFACQVSVKGGDLDSVVPGTESGIVPKTGSTSIHSVKGGDLDSVMSGIVPKTGSGKEKESASLMNDSELSPDSRFRGNDGRDGYDSFHGYDHLRDSDNLPQNNKLPYNGSVPHNDKLFHNNNSFQSDEFYPNTHPLQNTSPLYKDKNNRNKKPHKKKIIVLEKGESTIIPSPYFERIWVSKAGILSVQDRGSSLHIQARKEGEVLLNIGSRLYHIHILGEEQKNHLISINEFLSHRMGLEARMIKDKVHIQGTLHRLKDFKDLSELAQSLSLNYVFSAEVEPSLRKGLQNYIENNIAGEFHSAPPVFLWQKPLTVLVSDGRSDFYQESLKKFGVTVKKDPSLLPIPSLVKLKILLVESSANHSFQTHIDWGEKIINRILDGSLFKQLLSDFKSMENKGKAHIFSETVLLSESGKKSHFHSGGEVPIPHFNPESGAQNIRWKPYGIRLNFETRADRKNTIHIRTEAEISEVDHSHSVQSAPSLKSSRIHSSITMKSGQSLLLSKLVRRQKGKSHSAPLALSRLPWAGSILSFKGKIKEHTRLSILITALLLKTNTENKRHANR